MLTKAASHVTSAGVIERPGRLAANAAWEDILPLLGQADRSHVGRILESSRAAASLRLSTSRQVFVNAFPGLSEDMLDEWMAVLAITPIEDFIDHHVPFLRNTAEMAHTHSMTRLVRNYLKIYFT